jgi:hypothetical protein
LELLTRRFDRGGPIILGDLRIGRVYVDDQVLEEGDGGSLSGPATFVLEGVESAEVLLFDLS